MPDISVIIPTFNRKSLLERAIRSVLAQKKASFEILVADDGSTDRTTEFLRQEFSAIRVLSWRENRGPSYARNRAAKAAAGRWLAFLDSDDEWLPAKLAAQLDFFKSRPDYRICQTEEIWIRNGIRVNPMKKHQKFGGNIFEKCLPLCVISPSAVMLEKTLFEETGGFDESLPACEDYDLWLRIAAQYPVGLIAKPHVVKYGGHADQRSREFQAMDRFRIYALKKILGSGVLNETQTQAAAKMLAEKETIFAAGAVKYGNSVILSHAAGKAKNLGDPSCLAGRWARRSG